MLSSSRSWGLLLFRGILAVLFGCLALSHPLSAATALVWVFGAYAFVDGCIALAAAFQMSQHRGDRWWGLLSSGVLGLMAGIVALFLPAAITAAALVYVVAFWAVFSGIAEIVAAFRLRREIAGEAFLLLGGIVSLLLGMFLFVAPLAGVVAWIWCLAVYALVYGVSMIILAFRVRGHLQRLAASDVSRREPVDLRASGT